MSQSIVSLPALARATVETYAQTTEIIAPSQDEALAAFRAKQAGVFVTINKQGQLRGCIGTIGPTKENIIEETIANAISASQRDPRFPPVQAEELTELSYSVSVLHEPESIGSLEQLNVDKYGVIVTSGARRGLLLPHIDSVTSVQQQVAIAMQKGGIRPGEPISLFRFQVDKFEE